MTAAGIICEYNPIHNGHVYHIAETKRASGGAVVCAMSGNFVQRGEPAVFPKHIRAEAAIKAGADLVIELPINISLSSAENFAAGGVRLLASLGVVTALSFGCESGSTESIKNAAALLASGECDAAIREKLSSGVSYASAREEAFFQLGGDREVLRRPNDILAVEYAKAAVRYAPQLSLHAVKRTGTMHDSAGCSSSSLRELLCSGESPAGYMPDECAAVFARAAGEGISPVFQNDDVILSRLRRMTEAEYERLPDSGEGLYKRLYKNAVKYSSVREIIEATKTKRYAYSRIKRMVMCAALGITDDMIRSEAPFVRVLAANETGRALLHEIREKCTLPILSKPSAAKSLTGYAGDVFELTCRSTDLYALFMTGKHRIGGQEMMISPVMV